MDLDKLYKDYNNKKNNDKRATKKQLALIKNIYIKLQNNETIEEYSSKVLGKNDLTTLTNSDINNIINQINTHHKLKYLINVDLKIISNIIKKNISNLDEITPIDYKKIINNPIINFSHSLKNLYVYNLPQDTILENNISYEYGYQKSELCDKKKLYYLKFYNFLMLDYDRITLDELSTILDKSGLYENNLFYIYQTFAGFHVFLVSKQMIYNNQSTAFFMRKMKCDNWYTLFSYKFGFRIRLNIKKNRNEKQVHKFIKIWGKGKKNQMCIENINLLNRYLEIHSII